MLKHRHHIRSARWIFCNGKRTTARIEDGWWRCARCGKPLWESAVKEAKSGL